MVGNEYFMTKGHFHEQRHRGEYYLTVIGCGALILMDESRRTTFEPMRPSSLHSIPYGAPRGKCGEYHVVVHGLLAQRRGT